MNTFESIVFESPVERKCPFCVTEEDRTRWEEEDKKKAEEEAKKKADEEEKKKEEEAKKDKDMVEEPADKKEAAGGSDKQGEQSQDQNPKPEGETKMDIETKQ